MGDELASWAERRRAVRVPVRGIAVLHADDGLLHGSIENLSQGGALLNLATRPHDLDVELELRLAAGGGWVSAHTVRTEPLGNAYAGWRIAVAFDRVDPKMRASIDASIQDALSAARRRPILVIDDRGDRRTTLIALLAKEGMTPLAPRTPLDAIDLLTRAQLHVSVCLLAPGFGVPSSDLASILSDSFPWVTTAAISDDLHETVTRAVVAWSTTPVARIATAIG
jgi:hypothetical protein